uniref:Uncharacterized protein n=1 Tax=Solanum tuberosum TaxID=4113 RepID=M1BZC0_SOLTU
MGKTVLCTRFQTKSPKIRMKRSRGGCCRGSCGSYCLLTREGEDVYRVVHVCYRLLHLHVVCCSVSGCRLLLLL